MPYGDWINDLPTGFFLVVHIAAFAIGAGFAWVAFKRELSLLGTGFALTAHVGHHCMHPASGFVTNRFGRRPNARLVATANHEVTAFA